MITIIVILSVLSVVFMFTTFNLLRKLENREDTIDSTIKVLDELNKIFTQSEAKLKELDLQQRFSSDDEIGWFFNYVKFLQSEIKKLLTKI
jgi:hypothetical protein